MEVEELIQERVDTLAELRHGSPRLLMSRV
jgi:hypothetical protein